ncbi:hypothetical protein DPMN_193934 [Dreissena polymorpha]|uniref:Uncharacterized protein n=1 Tax=Dreissena polymorpha TaxID=45954 RepID=A0A9D3Y1U8_DREPO|nr:hypothetical protein DPMN_193934 [Dreissena polymorpha]
MKYTATCELQEWSQLKPGCKHASLPSESLHHITAKLRLFYSEGRLLSVGSKRSCNCSIDAELLHIVYGRLLNLCYFYYT